MVIGILIALQVNNLNNIHTEKHKLQNYLGKITDIVGNYTDELCQHPGHHIVLSLLYRGYVFAAYLTDFYEEQISVGKELLKSIEDNNEIG